jgi:hypothetical protein
MSEVYRDPDARDAERRLDEELDLRDESVTSLIKRLAIDAQTLVRQEIELAKTEVTEQIDQAKGTAQRTVQLTKEEATHGVQRVKEEVSANGKKAGIAVGMYAGAGVLALFTFGVLTYAFIAALATVLPTWGAALVVAIVYAVIIGVLVVLAKKRLNDALPLLEPETIEDEKQRITSIIERGKEGVTDALPPMPEQTIESIKEDVEWAKNQPQSEKR